MKESSLASFAPTSFRVQPAVAQKGPDLDLRAAGELIAVSWQRAGNHIPCFTGPSRDLRNSWEVQPESFTATVIADLLIGQPEHRGLVASILAMLEDEMRADGLFHFFKEHERLPADADCTALALSVLLRGGSLVSDRANHALDLIIANSNAEDVVETYFDPTGERSGIIDPVVCANVLFLGHMLARGDELAPTLEYLRRVLVAREYSKGTRYYHSPDTFLYFTARLVRRFPAVHTQLLAPLEDAVRERQGATGFPLDIAQRVIISRWLRIDDGGESQKLIELQQDDGCWPADSLFRYGRKRIFFGSRLVTTAFALRALRSLEVSGFSTHGLPRPSRARTAHPLPAL